MFFMPWINNLEGKVAADAEQTIVERDMLLKCLLVYESYLSIDPSITEAWMNRFWNTNKFFNQER